MHTTYATFKVLTAALIKIQVFWNVTPCLLVVTDVSKEVTVSRFRSTVRHCAGTKALPTEVQSYSKSSVPTDQSPWRHILSDLNLHTPTSYTSMRFTIIRQQTTLRYYLLLTLCTTSYICITQQTLFPED